MAEKKRGLHRGLEALLVSAQHPLSVPPPPTPPIACDTVSNPEQVMITRLQYENHLLLQEATLLHELLCDVEFLLHHLNQE